MALTHARAYDEREWDDGDRIGSHRAQYVGSGAAQRATAYRGDPRDPLDQSSLGQVDVAKEIEIWRAQYRKKDQAAANIPNANRSVASNGRLENCSGSSQNIVGPVKLALQRFFKMRTTEDVWLWVSLVGCLLYIIALIF